ncbi:MAG: helix-turn-helix domain-containing protein [Steroidobacteraceae bacterium]
MSELSELAELLGENETLRLIELYGGTRLTVPRVIGDGHPLAAEMGAEAAARLERFFGGSEVKVPMARSWRSAIYRARGLTYREIARKLGCTESAVYGFFARARAGAAAAAVEERG